MMARILLQFGLGLFTATDTMPISSLACWRCFAGQAFQSTLCHGLGAGCGVILSMLLGKINPVTADFSLAIPQFIAGMDLEFHPESGPPAYSGQSVGPVLTRNGHYQDQWI